MLETTASAEAADLIVYNGKIATQDERRSFVTALAVKDGRVLATGSGHDVMRHAGERTQRIDLNGRTVIPGLNDSHLHAIRGGLNFNLELRWDGVPTLADALGMLRRQVLRTPAPHWVRVVGGWTEFQFAEKRGPTVAELNAIAPDTPVFIMHLGDSALLNAAALRAIGYGRDTSDPPGGEIQRDRLSRPTGMLIARPDMSVLHAALERAPKLGLDDQMNSMRHFMRELNRLGVTSAIDAGGDFQAYPDDYGAVLALAQRGEMTVRIAYSLFVQHAGRELDDYARWVTLAKPGDGDAFLRMNGAGELLVYSAADFGNFLEPRPDLPAALETELTEVVRLLVRHRWPFRLHATYDESIGRFLDVLEAVNREIPFDGLRWFFDHCETISDANIARIAALGGGVTVQHRMAFQGEYFIARYGAQAATRTPPIRAMLDAGLPVGAGTDATRIASYNPFVSLYWMVSGRTVGGTALYPERNRLDRMEALRRYTVGSAWFSNEDDCKGALVPGQYADFAVLTDDYFTIDEARIKSLASVLTVVDGKVVHADDEFETLAPPPLPVSPAWSPVAEFGGFARRRSTASMPMRASADGNPDARVARGHARRFAQCVQAAVRDVAEQCEGFVRHGAAA
ncbi:TPA: amidohydrolase [Burkholderia territorii]|uniref:amidohydrolase n=1 Tax=Burkholderia territorii TaxID=1503055 RepID=UPI000758B90C|nr:amidohydrolase [Burkholderia territorii]KWH06520.1 amidohydrolase [Burkholderia territorii]TXG02980.1 amidohydrolase [Burkholderia territorii]HDR8860344.1 amidohydrolase [Burkholderia territorii]HDR8865030.1 amidohydrolase [Burkholderia territorii]HDR8872771.1 amidohydrolase [Burkholderia territorii]